MTASLRADTYSLTGSNPANGTWKTWTDTANWTPAGGPPNGIGDIANISITWSFNGNRGLTVDDNTQILKLLVGQSDSAAANSGGAGLSSLTNKTLSIGNASTDGYLGVGSTSGNKNATGRLGLGLATAESMLTINLYGGSFEVASRNKDSVVDNIGLLGEVEIGKGVTLNIGTSTKRSEWDIAYTQSKDSYKLTGSVTDVSGATINAYLSTLRIASTPGDSAGGGGWRG